MMHGDAQDIADRIVTVLAPACERIEVAGSLRRRCPEVRDIDLLLIPRDRIALLILIIELYGRKPEKLGEKYLMLKSFDGMQIDLYLATPETWATLLLIRTGSKDHNIRLAQRARQYGWTLKANGEGLIDSDGDHIASTSELHIFRHLLLPYCDPWERD